MNPSFDKKLSSFKCSKSISERKPIFLKLEMKFSNYIVCYVLKDITI